MKKLYTSILFTSIFHLTSQAQLTISKSLNEPVIGDVYVLQDYDSINVIPKTTGTGQLWNFTTLAVGGFSETVTYTTVASAPSSTAFPTATMASNRNGNNWEFWKSSATMLEFEGMSQNASTDRTVFSNLATWTNWPVAFGNTNSDAFLATDYSGTVTSTWSGNISYTATGTGTVILPGGNIHTNCLQITKTISLSITSGTNTTILDIKEMEYWSSLSKFPILKVNYETTTVGTVTSKDYGIDVNIVAQSVGIKEEQHLSNDFVIYPNPATDNVNVFIPNRSIASSIEIIDISGRVIASISESNTINVSNLAKAVYTIRVKTKDAVLQRSLAITD